METTITKLGFSAFGAAFFRLQMQQAGSWVTLSPDTFAIVPGFDINDPAQIDNILLFLRNVRAWPVENGEAATNAALLLLEYNTNPAVFSVSELAFLAKTVAFFDWLPVTLSFSNWVNLAKIRSLNEFNAGIAQLAGVTPNLSPPLVPGVAGVDCKNAIVAYLTANAQPLLLAKVNELWAKQPPLSDSDWCLLKDRIAGTDFYRLSPAKYLQVLTLVLGGRSVNQALSLIVDTTGYTPPPNPTPNPTPKPPPEPEKEVWYKNKNYQAAGGAALSVLLYFLSRKK